MQLGTRWSVGEQPPARLTEGMVDAIRAVEAEIGDRPDWRWTLTWLESRPVVALDDGTTIRMGHDGTLSTTQE